MSNKISLAAEFDEARVQATVELRVLHYYAQRAVNSGVVDDGLVKAVEVATQAEARLEAARRKIIGTVEA